MTWLNVVECLCHKWSRICSVWRNHNSVLSLFKTCHWICNKSKTMDVFRRTWVHPPFFSGVRVARSLVFCVVFVDYCLSFYLFFFWPLHWLSFDLRLLITPLVSSNFSSINMLQHSAAPAYGIYITIWSFTYARLITGFVRRVPQRVSLVEQVLFMLFVSIHEYCRPTRFSHHNIVPSFQQ